MAASDSPTAAPSGALERSSTLDASSREVLGSVVRMLAASGSDPREIAREVEKNCRKIAASWAPPPPKPVSTLNAAGHVLTLWFSEPAYTDARGRPRPLPLRGERSLEALALQWDASFDVEEVLSHLLRPGVLRRQGSRYVPRRRVLFASQTGTYHSRVVERVAAILRTMEHNSQPEHTTSRWYERVALNNRFPVRERAQFDQRLREAFDAIVFRIDAEMHEKERRRKRGEPTVGLQLGVFLSEFEPSVPQRRAKPRRHRRKSP